MKISKYLLLSGILVFLIVPIQKLKAQENHMRDKDPVSKNATIGEVNFKVNCSDNVRDDFDVALGMLHHMMYATARENFKKIAATDPNCAMAYWGLATTLFQPLWGTRPSREELQQGWEYINKARELADSDRETLLIESTREFFRDPGTTDFRSRIQRWTDAVATAYGSYPNDPDIAAFYGLTRLTKAQFADDRAPLIDEAEAVLRKIFELNPEHPGAVHYSIHATDVDGRAENALDIVEAYGKIAPSVPHALHMPTHIYVRLGDWPKVIEWNVRSAEAALNHPVNGSISHHYLHAQDYLVYAYLQRGEDEKAEEQYNEALRRDKYQASFVSAFHFSAMPARLAVEQRDWERASALKPRTPAYLPWDESPWAEALTWYAKGLGAVHTGDVEAAKTAGKKLENLRDFAKESGADNMASYIEIDRRVLNGWIEYEGGSKSEAVELMQSAADLEEKMEKHPVTPGALQPPKEALGDLYMKLNRPSDALDAYVASDNIWPGRMNTLMGAALAARARGDEQTSRKFFKKLLKTAGYSKPTDTIEQ